MVLMVLLLVFLLAVLVIQALHGLFSALIMVVLTVCCAALALGTYEWVALNWVMEVWRPDYAYAVSLALTFGVPLLLLRLAMDKTIQRTSLLPAIVDRVGGGICGLITALIVVGIFSLVAQMIPFERGNFMGYARTAYTSAEFDEDADIDPVPADPYKETKLFPHADSFAAGMISLLSDGVFSSTRRFREDHPHYVQAVAWANAVPAEVQRLARPGTISIVETAPLEEVYSHMPSTRRREAKHEPIQPPSGMQFQRIRVKLSREAGGDYRRVFFTLRQFRLVGRDRRGGPPTHYFAMALKSAEDPTKFVKEVGFTDQPGVWATVDEVYALEDDTDEIDVIYELPRSFQADYLEYKIAARAKVRFSQPDDDDGAADFGSPRASAGRSSSAPGSYASSSPGATTVPSTKRGGNVRGATVRVGASHFGNRIPLTMTSYQPSSNLDIRKGALADGHLVGYLVDQADGRKPPVSSFDVPRDKRLLHLNVQNLRARSTYGKALASAVKSSQNYTVEDYNGKRYQLVGKYAVARVGNDEVFEVQYFSHQAGSIGGVGKFKSIQDKHLTREYELVLLFLVDPGAQIVRFSTGGSASRGDDLRNEGLTAPP